jgi:tudor domain-containing protein 1/4/6/7
VFNEFLEFEKELQTYYDDVRLRSEFVLLKKPQLGQMCVAKYAEDNQWYRALIKDISESQKHVRVFFVDYGNEEVMQVDGNLLLINEQFKLFPFMAVRCCLDGVKPSTQAFDLQMSEVADFMYETMPEQVLAVFVRKVRFYKFISSQGDF